MKLHSSDKRHLQKYSSREVFSVYYNKHLIVKTFPLRGLSPEQNHSYSTPYSPDQIKQEHMRTGKKDTNLSSFAGAILLVRHQLKRM